MSDLPVANTPGKVPYIADDTRNWIDAYRVAGKIKPAFLFRASSDANYIHSEWRTDLPAYNGHPALTQAVCNILSPGQRIPGCLNWSVTESLNNTVNQAQLVVLDALPVSTISATITGFGIGTKGSNLFFAQTPFPNYTNIYNGSTAMPAQWHSPVIRYQWVMNGNGLSTQLPCNVDGPGPPGWNPPPQGPVDGVPGAGNNRVSTWVDQTTGHAFMEENLQYRMFESEIIYVDNLSEFPNPACPAEEAEDGFNIEDDTVSEWWEIDYSYNLRGIGAFYIQVGTEVMRITMIDRANNALYVIPGGRGAAGFIGQHSIGDQVQLLGQAPFTGDWAGFGYLMPSDFAVEQSILRPGNCFVSYEGYGNPGDYLDLFGNPIPLKAAGWNPGANSADPTMNMYDRRHNMQFTGYWFVTSPEITLDDTGVPQVTCTLNSSGYVLTQQQITQDNLLRMKGVIDNWASTVFDSIGETRQIPGSWLDFNNWDPTWPNSYPLKIEISYAQDEDFLNHMASTDFGTQCPQCVQELQDYVNQFEGGQATGSIAETRSVGKHIYEESICVFNNGTDYDAGPLKTYGRLMTALGIASWENPSAGNVLGSRWTKIPARLYKNMNNWENGRTWNGQLNYSWSTTDGLTSQTYDYTNPTDTIETAAPGNRIPLTCPFTGSYDRQPWTDPMTDLCSVNRMSYYITREGYPVFVPMGRKLRGVGGSNVSAKISPTLFVDQATGIESADNDVARGEWHLAYGGSIDQYDHTIDPSSVITVCYVTGNTAIASDDGGSAVTFTLAAGGTGLQINQTNSTASTQQLVWYPGIVGNVDGLKLTGGVQVSNEVSLDQLQLGLDWNTKPSGMSLTVDPTTNLYQLVPAIPTVPDPGGYVYELGSDATTRYTSTVIALEKLLNFMLVRRYIGGQVAVPLAGLVATPSLLNESGNWTATTTVDLVLLQDFLANSAASGAPTDQSHPGWYTTELTFVNENAGGQTQTVYNNFTRAGRGIYDRATYQAMKNWALASAEYIETDIWWYAMASMSWNDYVMAVAGLEPPQYLQTSDGTSLYAVDQTALSLKISNWSKQFDADVVNYGNMIVDTSIQQASQTVLSVNFADPRILIGDVVWAQVPAYMSVQNSYGDARRPFNNGVYVTDITRTIDLQNGTYQGTYTGYAYRGFFDDTAMGNPVNYVSSQNGSV